MPAVPSHLSPPHPFPFPGSTRRSELSEKKGAPAGYYRKPRIKVTPVKTTAMLVRGTQGACPATAGSRLRRSRGAGRHVGAGQLGACAPTAGSPPYRPAGARPRERGSHACAGHVPPVIFDPVPRHMRGRSLIDMVVFSCRSESSAQGHQADWEGCMLLSPTA